MDSIAPFLEDIAANPHDDTPRLVLADWIEENGDESLRPLGEFIRVQYALEGMHPGNPRRAGLEKLQQALLPAQLERWKDALRRLNEPRPVFRRGFIEGVQANADDLMALDANSVFGLPLRSLELRYYAEPVEPRHRGRPQRSELLIRMSTLRILGQIEDLDLTGMSFPTGDTIRAWMASPRLARVSKLWLPCNPAVVAGFLDSPLRQRVRSLGIHLQPVNPWLEGLGERDWTDTLLHASPTLPALESLAICVSLLPQPRFADLLAALDTPALSRVRFLPDPNITRASHPARLDLLPHSILQRAREVDFSGGSPATLLSLPTLARLESLTLARCGLNVETLTPLCGLGTPPLLWSLDLSTNPLGNWGARVLASAPLLRDLRSFRASYCRIGRYGAISLCRALPPNLSSLDLSWNPIGSEPLSHLAADSLEAVDLSYCELDDRTAHALSSWPAGKLNSLNLGTNRLTDAGAAALLASPALANIEALDLSNNQLTDRTADALLVSPIARNLRLLLLFGNGISDDALRRLRAGFRGIIS